MTADPDRDLARAKMSDLAESFHVLINRPGVRPWVPAALDAWATDDGGTAAEKDAARFVLSVWNPDNDWRCGPFVLHDALKRWDEKNIQAFARWAARPWYP